MDEIDPNQQDPDDRLRRFLEANEEKLNHPDQAQIPPTGSEQPEESADEPQPGDGDQSGDVDPSELPTGGYRVSPGERHPTGQPEATGGWYGSDPGSAPQASEDGQTIPVEADDPIQEAKPITQPQPSSADIPTQPVKVQRPSQQNTIPPVRSARPAQPLPQRVDQVDVNATRVTPSAYGSNGPVRAQRPANQAYNSTYPQQQPGYQRPGYPPAGVPPVPPLARGRRGRNGNGNGISRQRTWGCLLRSMIGLLFLGVIAVLIIGSFGVYQYFRIANTLPPVDNLRNKASQFETTRILDRNGNVLYEILDPNAGRRTYVPLNKISPYLIAATLATEDKEFWSHPGFDPVAIVRALWQNYTTGDIASGASTITQQLARMLLLTPTERNERTVQRKAREIVLAAEITRRYSKNDILELYLNESYYSNLSYGIEAASETYFNTTAEKLNLAQASFLAGLPQAPGVYDIFTNRDATLTRHKQVLTLMYQESKERDCIDVGPQANKVCVDAPAAQQAAKEIQDYKFNRQQNAIRYPHWVTYIRALLEKQFDAQTIYRSGFTVYTTLNPDLQDQAQAIVKQQVDTLADRHVTDGALVSIRPSTGEILAMVGSADFYNNAIAGQVNMAVSPRQPGSSIKPLTYTAAFEKGWTPSTLIWDVPSEFPPSGDPNDPREPYRPVNYDGRYHGPVTVRTALANSYNIPAVKTLQFVGIYDNPNTPGQDGLINFARRMGIGTLNRPDYGLSLTLGGGEVTVLDMTSAFGVFANNGMRVPPVAITKISDYTGNTVYEYQPPDPDQVIRPEHAFLINSILSDNEARTPAFGPNSVLNLPFQAAVKTGTTNDYRDNWTIGYTPDLVTGVWVGNADYTPMIDTTGLTGAAPIWSQFMQFAVPTITGGNPTPFSRPPGIVDKVICTVSGTEPSEFCPNQRGEVFAADQLPQPKKDDLWQKLNIDTWTGLRASAACADFTDEKFSLNVTDTWAQKWIRETDDGRAWAEQMGFKDPIFFTPSRDCRLDDPRPTVLFAGINDNQTITNTPLDIYAVVWAAKNFNRWRLEWGVGDDPVEWNQLLKGVTDQFKEPQKIYSWDMKDVPPGKTITLRLYLVSSNNTYAERKIRIRNDVPTATPTATVTATETEIPSLTPTTTETPEPSTPTPTHPATQAPTATETPPAMAANPAVGDTGVPIIDLKLPPFLQTLFPVKSTAAKPTAQVVVEPTDTIVPEATATWTSVPVVAAVTVPAEEAPTASPSPSPTPTCIAFVPSATFDGTATATPVMVNCTPTPLPTLTHTPSPLATQTPGFSIWDWLFGKH